MKIKGTCANCGREFVPGLVVQAGGHCPWCGKAFNRDYTSLLVEALRQADQAGNLLEDALRDIASIEELAMDIDEESVLEPLRAALRDIRRRRARV